MTKTQKSPVAEHVREPILNKEAPSTPYSVRGRVADLKAGTGAVLQLAARLGAVNIQSALQGCA
jgi:hypothetical protein